MMLDIGYDDQTLEKDAADSKNLVISDHFPNLGLIMSSQRHTERQQAKRWIADNIILKSRPFLPVSVQLKNLAKKVRFRRLVVKYETSIETSKAESLSCISRSCKSRRPAPKGVVLSTTSLVYWSPSCTPQRGHDQIHSQTRNGTFDHRLIELHFARKNFLLCPTSLTIGGQVVSKTSTLFYKQRVCIATISRKYYQLHRLPLHEVRASRARRKGFLLVDMTA